jgi:pimeloyl-ACP methyl ester carboxylesterase
MASLPIPFLGLLGTVDEPMGWGARARDVLPWIPQGGHLEVLEDIGHFIHIEDPQRVSKLVLDFLS